MTTNPILLELGRRSFSAVRVEESDHEGHDEREALSFARTSSRAEVLFL